ncbi:MAG: PepSY domain-containing protein [Betaproteobacteria bacterium]|nr:PepSY domain-containing protein [Betaproteobacteria bacterium]
MSTPTRPALPPRREPRGFGYLLRAMGGLLVMLLAAQSGLAQWQPSGGPREHGVRRGAPAARSRITLGQAMQRIEAQTGGRVVNATQVSEYGHAVYRIKVLTREGEVRTYQVDARTGAIQ